MPKHRLSTAGIGLLLLISPLCLYFFFRLFATNHYKLPIYLSERSASAPSICAIREYPYTIFSSRHRKDFYRPQVKTYLIHKLGTSQNFQAINKLYQQAAGLDNLYIHSLMERGSSCAPPEQTRQMTTHVLSKDSLTWLSTCVFYAPTLFSTLPKPLPESWLMIVDATGHIRNFSDTSKKSTQDIWASVILLHSTRT